MTRLCRMMCPLFSMLARFGGCSLAALVRSSLLPTLTSCARTPYSEACGNTRAVRGHVPVPSLKRNAISDPVQNACHPRSIHVSPVANVFGHTRARRCLLNDMQTLAGGCLGYNQNTTRGYGRPLLECFTMLWEFGSACLVRSAESTSCFSLDVAAICSASAAQPQARTRVSSPSTYLFPDVFS